MYKKSIGIILRILFAVVLIALTAGFIFVGWADSRLQSFLYHSFGAELSYERVAFHQNEMVLSKVVLKSTDSSKGFDYSLSFPQVKVSYVFDLPKATLDLQLLFQEPHLTLRKVNSKEFPLKNWQEQLFAQASAKSTKSNPWFHINTQAVFEKGKIDLQIDDEIKSIASEMFQCIDYTKPGQFSFVEIPLNRGILIKQAKQEDGINRTYSAAQVNCSELMHVVEFLGGPILNPWVLQGGIVDAQFSIIGENEGSYIKGNGTVHDIQIDHTTSGMGAFIKEVSIDLSKRPQRPNNAHSDGLHQLLTNTRGQLTLTQPAAFFRHLDRASEWILKDLIGSASFGEEDSNDRLRWNFSGFLVSDDNPDSQLELSGGIPLYEHEGSTGHITVSRSIANRLKVLTELDMTSIDPAHKEIVLNVENWGPEEFDVVMHLWPNFNFFGPSLQIRTGNISAKVAARLQGSLSTEDCALSSVSVSEVSGRDLSFSWHNDQVLGDLKELKGWMNLAVLNQKGVLSLSLHGCEVEFAGGQLKTHALLNELKSQFSIDTLSNFSGSVSFDEGVLQNGNLKGDFAGINTEIDFHGLSSETVASVSLEGMIEQVADLLPADWLKLHARSFLKDRFKFQSSLRRTSDGMHADGRIVLNDLSGAISSGDFDVDFIRVAPDDWKNLHTVWREWGVWALREQKKGEKSSNSPALQRVFLVDWLEDSAGIWGIKLGQGRFITSNFQLERYLSSVLFEKDSSMIRGDGKLQGSFDEKTLLVQVHAKDALIETPNFHINLEEVGRFSSGSEKSLKQSAYFYFDFENHSKYGLVPVANASFLDKKHDLLYTNIDAQVHFNDKQIRVENLSSACDELVLQGNLLIDFSVPETTLLTIESDQISGSLHSALSFGGHFTPSDAWKIPIRGHFISGEKGLFLHAVIPDASEIENQVTWKIKAAVDAMSYDFNKINASFANLKMNLDYQSLNSALSLSDIHGNLLVGKADQQETYFLDVDYFKMIDFSAPQAFFDLRISKLDREIARLSGAAKSILKEDKSLVSSVQLDSKATHFGSLYPNVKQFEIKDWQEVTALKALPKLDLRFLLEDLQILSKLGWMQFPAVMLEKADVSQLQGLVKGQVTSFISSKGVEIGFNMIGDEVKWKNQLVGPVQLKGVYSPGGHYDLETARWGSLHMKGALQNDLNGFKIPTFSVSQGDGFRLALSADYHGDTGRFLVRIPECYANFAKLQVLPEWGEFLKPWRLKGSMTLSGEVNFIPEQLDGNVDILGRVQANLREFEVRGMPIHTTAPIGLSFSSKEGFRIEGIDLNIKRLDRTSHHAALALKSVKYQIDGDTLTLDGLDFSVSDTCLLQLSSIGQELFPNLFDSTASAFLKDFQCQGGLSGSMQMQLSPAETKVRLGLRNGLYSLWGQAFDLQNVFLDFDSTQIRFRAEHPYRDALLGVTLQVDRSSKHDGRVVIRDLKDTQPQSPPLIIYGDWNASHGVSVQKIEGMLAGVEFNLLCERDPYNSQAQMVLNGMMRLRDGTKLTSVLPPENAQVIKRLNLLYGYELHGRFALPKTNWMEMNFKGNLIGKNFTLLGNLIDGLSADVLFTPNHVLVQNFKMNDDAGLITAREMSFSSDQNNYWYFSIPKIDVKELRPIKLTRSKPYSDLQKLLIEEGSIENLKGYLANSKTYTGTGMVYFENLPRKNFLERTLLLLPAEIIGRIGLNTNVLEPAMGTIMFSLRNGRVYLNKLKDVYSEGKRSRFYLPKSLQQSYIDYDGNLHINLKTTQYNLLFKLADLGQLRIRGTLEKPDFSFQKRPESGPKR